MSKNKWSSKLLNRTRERMEFNKRKDNNALIKAYGLEDYICMSIYSRNFKHKSYYIPRKTFLNWNGSTVYDVDISNLLKAYADKNTAYLNFSWVTYETKDKFNGFTQRIELPIDDFRKIINLGEKESFSTLYIEKDKKAKIVNNANAAIKCVLKDKRTKRAFCKAIRDNFQYKDKVILNSEGRNSCDMFFRDNFGCGGLIRHTTVVINKNGNFEKTYFGIHT